MNINIWSKPLQGELSGFEREISSFYRKQFNERKIVFFRYL